MLTLTNGAQLGAVAEDPRADHHLRALLRLRLGQTGGEGADYHVLGPADTPADAEAAVG